jgi:predicted Rossmann-fold nucleotide-binding protein
MMSEASPDGVLTVHPDIQDQLALGFLLEDVAPQVMERMVDHRGWAISDHIAGRSAAGQLGMDVVRAAGAVVVYEDRLHVPIDINAYTEIGEGIVADIEELRSQKEPGKSLQWSERDIEFGRLVNYDNLKHLEKDDVERAISERLISFDPSCQSAENPTYEVNDDGSVSLPFSLLEFVFNEEMLRSPEQRFNALHHGRAGLIPHMDAVPRHKDEVLPEFMVGGTVFSPGPFYVKIREQLDEDGNIRQLPSAALFDGNRLMGTNPRQDAYSRNRQVEIVNEGSQQTFGETRVTIDVFRSSLPSAETVRPVVDWRGMSREQRSKTHINGVSPLDVIKASDPTSREFLLNAVAGPETGGLVISSHGISKVPRGDTPRFMAQNIRRAAESFGRYRDVPEGLEQLSLFVEALKPAADRSRLVVADELELRHIPNIIKSGDVRAMLMRRYLGSGDRGIAMSKEDHSAIVDLVRQGVSIAWENDGDLREMHRSGLWVTPEAADRIEELDLVIAMYGTHFDEKAAALEPDLDGFFEQLSELVPAENLGVTHGNMGGVMRLTDSLARERGIMSLGVGLDLSAVGQTEVNLQCDAFQIMEGHERLYRQEKLDKFNTISVYSEGGYGSLEELFITICSQKLSSCLPAPSILVSKNHLYDNAIELLQEVANQGLGQPWVVKSIELVDTHAEAFEVIKNFWEDPQAYWKQLGVTTTEIKTAYTNHQRVLKQMGMRLADNLKQAAETYEG